MHRAASKSLILLLLLLFSVSVHVQAAQPPVYHVSTLSLREDRGIPKDWAPLLGALELRAAPGQFVDFAFAVAAPDRKLNPVRPVLSLLSTEDGRVLRVPEERIRSVVCAYWPLGGLGGPADWGAPESYEYKPFALMYDHTLIRPDHKARRNKVTWDRWAPEAPPVRPRAIPKGEMRQWYVTVPIPRLAPAGTYIGALRFVQEDAVGRERLLVTVPVRLQVLPVTLLPPAKLYGIYTNFIDRRFPDYLSLDDPRLRLAYEDMAEHGFQNPWVQSRIRRVHDGKRWIYNFTDIEGDMLLRYEAGLEMDFVIWAGSGIQLHASDTDIEYHQRYVEPNREHARLLSRFWSAHPHYPPLVIYGYDEAHGIRLQSLKPTYEAIKRAGLAVGAACSPDYFEQTGASMMYPIMAGSVAPGTVAKVSAAQAKQAGATILSYDGPQMIFRDPFLNRVRAGFNLWNSIYDGWFPFTYAWALEDHRSGEFVTRGRANGYKHHGVVLIGRDRIIPLVEWPAMRQGVDDVRFATTLAAQVVAARQKKLKGKAVDEAERLLRRLAEECDSAEAVEAARQKLIDLILAMERVHPELRTQHIHRQAVQGDGVKALRAKVNEWIRPDLSYRPFPMGIEALKHGLDSIERLRKANRPFEAVMAAYALMARVAAWREAGKLSEIESFVANARIGGPLLKLEKASLEIQKDPKTGEPVYAEHLKLVRDLSDADWAFRPDRDNMGLEEKWFAQQVDRRQWKPIDVSKFWQHQGVADWQQLEGARVGEMGIGWYALEFDVPADWKGRKLYMWFNSDESAHVWVNGELVRERNEGSPQVRWHTPSLALLSGALKPGKRNTIVVRVYNSAQAGGLWRGVRVLEPK